MLRLSINNLMSGKLEHWNFDTFRLNFDQFWYGHDLVSFILNSQGKVASLRWGGAELMKAPEEKENRMSAR